MAVTLEVSKESEAALKGQARARGLTLEEWLMELAGQRAAGIDSAPAAD